MPAKTPPEATRVSKERALKKYLAGEEQGLCDVLFGDESGFALSPCVPYVWQMPGYPLLLPAHPHHKRLNVLGFWRSDNWMRYSTFNGRMTAARFIECIEADLIPSLRADRPTILVLDNAPIHKAKLVMAKRKEWKEKGLRLFFCPPIRLISTASNCCGDKSNTAGSNLRPTKTSKLWLTPSNSSSIKSAQNTSFLSPDYLRALFAVCGDGKNAGVRDQALLGVLYGCGLRRAESVALDVADYYKEEMS